MSWELQGPPWYKCRTCKALFKLKHLILRHLKTKHQFPEAPEWELEGDEKCLTWWERVRVDGASVEPVPLNAKPLQSPSESSSSTSTLQAQTSPSNYFDLLPEEVKKFKCNLCPVEMWFAFKKSLYAHLLKNHDQGICKIPGMNICRFCGARTESPTHLKAHIRTHTGEQEGEDTRVVECSSEGCGRVFSSKASMRKHLRFKCTEFKKEGEGGEGGSEVEKELEGPKINPHVCRQSSTDLPHKCPQCVETFPTAQRLHGHMGVHSGDLYRCRYCSAPFAHVHTRGAHETNAHNQELGVGYRCPVCYKKFANIATIRGHYKYTHWLDLPPKEVIESWRVGDESSTTPTATVGLEFDQNDPSYVLGMQRVYDIGPVNQVTIGALIGHIPTVTVQPTEPPPPQSSSTLTPPEQPPATPNKKEKKKVTKGKKKPVAVKVERKKFHCRKVGCEGKFQRRWELTWHLERAHGEFNCEFCPLPPFPTRIEMVHHQYQIHHRELGCYECRICGRGLESPRGVQEHVAIEHPQMDVPLTLEAKMWRRGAIHRKRVQRPQ